MSLRLAGIAATRLEQVVFKGAERGVRNRIRWRGCNSILACRPFEACWNTAIFRFARLAYHTGVTGPDSAQPDLLAHTARPVCTRGLAPARPDLLTARSGPAQPGSTTRLGPAQPSHTARPGPARPGLRPVCTHGPACLYTRPSRTGSHLLHCMCSLSLNVPTFRIYGNNCPPA